MAEPTPNPAPGGEEKSPLFQTGKEAFDRAGYEKTIRETGGLGTKAEDSEKARAADKVYGEARKYYFDKYTESLKKIDPAFDRNATETTSVYETTQGDDLRKIKKNIDEGKPLDGVKDISPLAENAAQNRISLTNKLKSGTVTTIAEYVGLTDIKEMKGYEDVASQFDSSTKDEKNKFEDLLGKFWNKYLRLFNEDSPGAASAMQKLYTPENNAIIAAIAKILEDDGFTSESVKNMSKRFEDNLKSYSGDKKVDGAMPTPGATGPTGPSPEAIKSGEKIEEKLEKKAEEKLKEKKEPAKAGEAKPEEKKAEGEKGAKAEPTKSTISEKTEAPAKEAPKAAEPIKSEQKMDSAKAAPAPAAPAADLKGKEPAKPIETSKQDLSKKEEKKEGDKGAPGVEKSGEKIEESKGQDSRVDFIKSLFGGMLGGAGGDTGTSGAGASIESSKEEIKKDTTKEAGAKPEAGKSKLPDSKMESSKPKISEKAEKKSETLPGGSAIKETSSQKLAKPSVEEPKKTEITTEGEPSSGVSKTTEKTEEPSSAPGGEEKKEGEGEKKEGKKEEGGGLEAKMDSMIGLLSQLNATMQGPLLTISSSKKYE